MPRKFKYDWNRSKIKGTLHEYQYTCLIVSHFFLERKMFQTNVVEEINIRILCSVTIFFRKSCSLWGNVEHYWRAEQATDCQAYAHCMLDAYKYTYSGCEIPLLFHYNNGRTNATRCYIIRTLPVMTLFMILVTVHYPICPYMSLPYPRSVTECQLWNVFSSLLPYDFPNHADVIWTPLLHCESGVASQIIFQTDLKAQHSLRTR
jgi:hypothetical protein